MGCWGIGLTVQIEICGWACKAPGADDRSAFWDLLTRGECAISEITRDRWDTRVFFHPRQHETGKSYTFRAGLMQNIWGFDPGMMGLSPREAEQMDPQQRIALQVVWNACEDAGVKPSALAGQEVGVYVGASGLDYANQAMLDPSIVGAHFMTGNTLSILANRISYIFDLNGPSFTVDTACSSSLVALNEAMKDLLSGRVDTAIVAGVNLLASPFPFIGFAQATMLAPDGLCRAFDAKGSGYVRAEGCFAFILRRSDAERWPGQKVEAVVAASGVNSDGRTSGLSLPSSDHQAALLQSLYADLDIHPDQLAFLEAHGTGTRVGDPAEAHSIGQVLGQGRSSPLPIGSVKTNVGHMEPASGLAGLAKAVLALQHDCLPRSLHFEEPNPDIDFDGLNLVVAGTALPLSRDGEKPRFAGVNSFGFGGTNAHVVISDPVPRGACENHQTIGRDYLVLTAQSRQALEDLAHAVSQQMRGEPDCSVAHLAAGFQARRDALSERLVVDCRAVDDVADALASVPDPTHGVQFREAQSGQGRVAFVYSGNGSQWAGMGVEAYRHNLAFKTSFDEVDALFEPLSGWSLTEALFKETLADDLTRTEIAQPLLFALQIALTDALAEEGMTADCVLGHSVGEVAAACVAGVLTRAQACHIILHRSLSQELVAGLGTMAALMLSEDDARAALDQLALPDLDIAASNSAQAVTISGSRASIDALAEAANREGWALTVLDLDYPFHSALIDEAEQAFLQAVGSVEPSSLHLDMISTVTGEPVQGVELDETYWWRNVREPVLFHKAVENAIGRGCRTLIEIGPRPVLKSYMRKTARAADNPVTVFSSFTRPTPSRPTASSDRVSKTRDPVRAIVCEALLHGVPLDQDRIFGHLPDRPIKLPLYPWQTEPYRFRITGEGASALFDGMVNPLLGWRMNAATLAWENHIDRFALPLLADHVIDELTLFPAAGYVDMMLAAGRDWRGDEDLALSDLDIIQPMVLSDDHLLDVRTTLSPEIGSVEILSRPRLSGDEFVLHARGRLSLADLSSPVSNLDEAGGDSLGEADENLTVSGTALYAGAREHGLNYGPFFQLVDDVTLVSPERIRLSLKAPDVAISDSDHILHPAALDSCFHGLFALFGVDETFHASDAYVPVRFDQIRVYAHGAEIDSAEIIIRRKSVHSILADFTIYGRDRTCLATLSGARFRAAHFGRREHWSDLIYREVFVSLRSPDQETGSLLARDAAQAIVSADEESGDASLLLDLASQAAALAVLTPSITEDRRVDLSLVPSDLRNYASSLLLHLERNDQVIHDETGWHVSQDTDLPDFSLLAATLMDDHPDEIAALTLLCHAVDRGKKLLSGHAMAGEISPQIVDHFQAGTPAVRARIAHCCACIEPYLTDRAPSEPLRILDLGGTGAALAYALLEQLPLMPCEITIVETDAQRVLRLEGTLSPDLPIEVLDLSGSLEVLDNQEPFDLVCSAGGAYLHALKHGNLSFLKSILAAGAPIVLVEPPVDCFYDLVFGLADNWFSGTSIDGYAVGALRSTDEWRSILKDLGACDLNMGEVIGSGQAMSVLTGCYEEKAADIIPLRADRDLSGHLFCLLVDDDFGRTIANHFLKTAAAHGAFVHVIDSEFSEDPTNSAVWRDLCASDVWAQADRRSILCLNGVFSSGVDPVAALSARGAAFAALCDGLQGQAAHIVAPASIDRDLPVEDTVCRQNTAIKALLRVMQNEAPDLTVHCLELGLDLDLDLAKRESASLMADTLLRHVSELSSGLSDETELQIDEAGYRAPRLVRGLPTVGDQRADAVCLGFDRAGSLGRLNWQAIDRPQPGAGEIVVDVLATGLNFRDVMWSLGLLPDEALEDGFSGPTLGLECSGRVVSVGEGVTAFEPGDLIVGFGAACFSSRMVMPAYAAVHLPAGMDPEAAATIPVTFLTSYYALYHLGQIQEGEWLLIHGGAGGVGLAALQLAQLRGARIIATAGSPEKRALLTHLGVDYVLDSRSLSFVDEVMALTGGEGVDVVLNSLSGEAMEQSIRLVKPFGRFLELGKRDYYGNTKIGLRPFRSNISYFGIDADQLLVHRRDLAHRLFKEVLDLFASGDLSPLPYRAFSGESVVDAFRLMQQSGHIGKIVVTPPKLANWPTRLTRSRFAVKSDGAVLVVGGLGGFGLEICRWLVDHGARHIVLTSRSGTPSDAHAELIQSYAEDGVRIEAMACDAANRSELGSLLTGIRKTSPLKGVLHAGMVLDDALLLQLTEDRFRSVLEPKVAGADNLHELTCDDPLDFFILFSSATTLVGNPGQANYVAANAYLEALIRQRRRAGLPGLAIGWGAIGDVGYLARNEEVGSLLSQKLGEATLSAREGLDCLARILSSPDMERQTSGDGPDGVYFIGRIDWSMVHSELAVAQTPRLAAFISTLSLRQADDDTRLDLTALLSGKSDSEARVLVAELLALELADILRLPQDKINIERSLSEFGMDSLMGLELRMSVQRKIGINLPIASLAGGITVNDLALQIVGRVMGDHRPVMAKDQTDGAVDLLLDQHTSGTDQADRDVVKDATRAVIDQTRGGG